MIRDSFCHVSFSCCQGGLLPSFASPARFERATFGLGSRCSILLSYEDIDSREDERRDQRRRHEEQPAETDEDHEENLTDSLGRVLSPVCPDRSPGGVGHERGVHHLSGGA